MRDSRPVSWIKAAKKSFEGFPSGAQEAIKDALTLAAEGSMASIAKPFKGAGSGVFEIALPYRAGMRIDVCMLYNWLMQFGFCMCFRKNLKPVSKRRSKMLI